MIIGVILLNLGGPDSLQAIKPFLFNLFSDREIIRLGPSFLQRPLARLISSIRSGKTAGYYRLIGGKSPILEITKAQAKALEESLNTVSLTPPVRGKLAGKEAPPAKCKVYVGMRYWHPFIEDAVTAMHRDGIQKVIALSLYPQYSVTTSGSSIAQFKKVSSALSMETSCISSWHTHPLYINALVDMIGKGLALFPDSLPADHSASPGDVHVLFSAHSLPQRIIDEGDPYEKQTKETIQEIAKKISIRWHLSYQSKSGPVRWLKPSTEDMLRELAGNGVKNILVVPISFVSDHIETLYEIDILYKQMASGLGMNLQRTASLNTHPVFIDALNDLVMKSIKESGW